MSKVADTVRDRGDAERFTASDADALAARLLGDLRTKLGGLHIEHARRVAQQVEPSGDDRVVAAALLHDVVEKGQVSLADLRAEVKDEQLVRLVDILTWREDESEELYLARCAADPMALAIKRADLADKHFHEDAQVDQGRKTQLAEEAQIRLELLHRLAPTDSPGRPVGSTSQNDPPGKGDVHPPGSTAG